MPGKPVEPVKRLLPPGVPPPAVVYVEGVKPTGGVVQWDGRRWVLTDPDDLGITSSGGGSGTVTSVAMTVPTGFTISGSPITGSGTLAIGLTGIDASKITSGTMATARLGSGTANSSKILYGDSTWGDVPSVGGVTMGVQILTSDDTNATGVLAAINSDLPVTVDADSVYLIEYYIIWQSSSTSSGVAFSIHVGFSFPAQFLLMHSEVPTGANATVERWQTDQGESGTITTSNTIDAANANRLAIVRVTIKTHAATPADIQLRYHGDGSDTITIKAGTFVRWTKIA